MKIEMVSIEKVIPYARNPRQNEEAIAKVAASLKEFGWQQPIVVDQEMIVIAGHTRLEAAKTLGMHEVPIHVADLKPKQAKAYRLADNRVSEDATWDRKLLSEELRELDDLKFDLNITGFTDLQLSNLLIDPELGYPDFDDEWQGMPEYISGDIQSFKKVTVHFEDQESLENFANLVQQQITDRTRFIWHPGKEREVQKDKIYTDNNLKYPVYIPSKGRSTTCNTPNLLRKNNIPFFLVVEPQDREAYIKNWGIDCIITMKENDKGIAYVRRFCKEHSKAQGDKFHWQIDDDIKNFLRRIDNKNIRCDPLDVLIPIENYIKDFNNIGIAGAKHSLFAWSAKNEIDFNKQICTCGLFNNSVDANWREGVIEDTDYSMQVLSKGYCSVLFNKLLYEPPPVGTNSGGNRAAGHYDKYLNLAKGLQSAWKDENGGDLFSIVEKNGEPRIKPNRVWVKFKQRPLQ